MVAGVAAGAGVPGRDIDCTEREGEEGMEVTRDVEVPAHGGNRGRVRRSFNKG